MLTAYLNLLKVVIIKNVMATFNVMWTYSSDDRPCLRGAYFYTDGCPHYFNNLNNYYVFKLNNK